MQKPGQFIGTTLIGNTIMLVLYGIFMAYLLEDPLKTWLPDAVNNDVVILLLQTVLSTLIVLVTGEFLPKSLFMLNPNSMLNFFALPFLSVYYLMFPLVWVIVGLSRFFIHPVLRVEYTDYQGRRKR